MAHKLAHEIESSVQPLAHRQRYQTLRMQILTVATVASATAAGYPRGSPIA